MDILTTNQQLKKSLSDAATVQLLDYFYQLKQPVILREIRAAFSEDQQLDKRLDLLIETGVIERKDRRYRLLLPIYQQFPVSEGFHQLAQLLEPRDLISFAEAFYPEELTGPLAVTFELPCRTVIENDKYALVTINARGTKALTLPNYFYYQQQKRPKELASLEQLIGDVHPTFFFNQLALLIEGYQQGKRPKRPSIFLESLKLTQLINEAEGQLNVPLVEKVAQLEAVSALWEQFDETERYFTYYQLLLNLLGTEDSFTYIIQKKA